MFKCKFVSENMCTINLTVLHSLSLPMAAPDREQLKIELQQVNQQITQQTQMHNMEVSITLKLSL